MSSTPRTIIITGATGGLGRAFSQRFSEKGDRLILTDLDAGASDVLAQTCGNGSVGYACDLGDPAQITEFWAWLDRTVGPPDVLLNNAGLGPSMQPTLATDTEDFGRVIDVNLVAPARMLQEAAARMRPGSSIVNTASLAGLVPNPKRNAYGAAKAALVDLTRRAARSLSDREISVTAIAPGYVLTDMVASLSREGNIALDAVRRRVPLGRLARPDEMASVVEFLASPDSRACAGQTLAVDGGWSAFNMGGDACPEPAAAPLGETEAEPAPAGKAVVLADAEFPSTALARALPDLPHVSLAKTSSDTAQRLASAGPVATVVAIGARSGTTGDLYRRDFDMLREALRAVRETAGTVVYVAPVHPEDGDIRLRDSGVAMLLRGLAAEFGPEKVRVNGIFANTETDASAQGTANLARFLAGPGASYMTGAILEVPLS